MDSGNEEIDVGRKLEFSVEDKHRALDNLKAIKLEALRLGAEPMRIYKFTINGRRELTTDEIEGEILKETELGVRLIREWREKHW